MILLAIDTAAALCAACVFDSGAGSERGRVVLDIGKTNSKVLAFDAGLDLVATYDTASISDGTHLDTAHGWAFILASLKEIAKRFRLSAIVPATWSPP